MADEGGAAASSSSDAVPKAKRKRERRSMDDLLAGFKKKLEKRIESGQRSEIHAGTDEIGKNPTPKIESRRHKGKGGKGGKGGGRSRDKDGQSDDDRGDRRSKRRRSPSDDKDKVIGRGGRYQLKRRARDQMRDRHSASTFKRPKQVKVSNIPDGLEYRIIKELFEGAAGKVAEGHVDADDETVVHFTFETSDGAATAYYEFDGGELGGTEIKVELIQEDDD
eukprot:TRINITY_DN89141_c0_g1_i1.p1 TRINITY_DN89141_c0_g1~~TRINITY_DN89141_c0_g1_i1.p1  ORF type:complete len:222 (+),score=58.63 TRINITY_DN89141_c0_g1_i1:106-771(+)